MGVARLVAGQAPAADEHPADPRELEAWAAELGVSGKTLARAFVSGTGGTLREWRLRARLHAATRHLALGASVQEAASLVGYASTSSFIAAFSQRFGTTPARYARKAGAGAGGT